MTSDPAPEAVVRLRLCDVRPSPTNPRQSLGDLDDLAVSIRAHGVLEPLVVRVTDPAADLSTATRQYEVIFGHRRAAAAARAGLAEVPAIVREATDAQVLEWQLVENVQRQDLTALEEGEGYRRLRDECGLTTVQLVERTGRNKAHVLARLKLLELTPPAREALAAGTLTPSSALPIARLAPELQGSALKALAGWGMDKGEPVPARDVEFTVQRIREKANQPPPDPEARERARAATRRAAAASKREAAKRATSEAMRKRKADVLRAGLALAIPVLVERAEATDLPAAAWRQLVLALGQWEAIEAAMARRGIGQMAPGRGPHAGDRQEAAFARYVATLEVPALRGLAVELLAWDGGPSDWRPAFTKDAVALAGAFKVHLDGYVSKAKAAAAKTAKGGAAEAEPAVGLLAQAVRATRAVPTSARGAR